jgi:sulfur-carrier protein
LKIKIQYLGLVKTYTNKSQEEFTLQEGTLLSELLNKIAASFGKQFIKEIFEPGQKDIKPMFTLMINGIVIGQLKGIETPLKDGDNVVLMPLMTGG